MDYTKPHGVLLLLSRNENVFINPDELQRLLKSWEDYYDNLSRQGKVVVKGIFKNKSGAFVILQISSDKEFEAIIENDPITKSELLEISLANPFMLE